MDFHISQTRIDGCFLLEPRVATDSRGSFTKVFHAPAFASRGLNSDWREEYLTVSKAGVIRGLHFQLPPHAVDKLVYCAEGQVLDVVVDLRVGSPTYGRHASFELRPELGRLVYIPEGLAHGFCVTGQSGVLVYKVSSVYSPEQDTGILWNSAGIDWPVGEPLLSERDRGFPALADFESPFVYRPFEARS